MRTPRLRLAVVIFAVALTSFAAGTIAQGRYPQITRAEFALQAALRHLQEGRITFGGHKRAAAALINQALGELQAAKAFAYQRGY